MTPVSLVTYEAGNNALKTAIELVNGLESLSPSDRIMIKPNLVAWDDQHPIAPYGVFTTTRLVEDLVILLKDLGCQHIRIGEGSVEVKKGVGTPRAFEGLGYKALEKRYGVNLVDFNQSSHDAFPIHDDLKLRIAKEALACDFFIDFPVLKTHGQTKVSLGMKNLKGCLKKTAKRQCHNPKYPLEDNFSHLADIIKPALTIIDGIYALERGAFHYGNAYPKNLIIASKDTFAADLAGAKLMGFDGKDIDHFGYYAARHGWSLDVNDLDIRGEALDAHIQPLKWDWTWTEENTGPGVFKKMGITGVALPKYDETLCSGCSPIANMSNLLVMSAFKGEPLPRVEILNGKKMQARPGFDKTVLLGNCIIKANENNPNISEVVEVKGCPPAEEDVVAAFQSVGLAVDPAFYQGYLKQQSEKYEGREGYHPEFFKAASD